MTTRSRAPLRAFAALVVLAFVAGCGERNLVLNVDVLSYLDPSTTQAAFGPVPAAPGGLYVPEQPIVDDLHVHLVDRPDDVAKVQAVSLTMAAQVTDSTGSGADTLRLYIADAATDPRTTPPVFEAPIAMTPGSIDTVSVHLDGDSRLVQAFDGNELRVSVTNAVRGPAAGAPLNGRLHITVIQATVVANRKGL
jgi:hypothetical protein